MLWNWISDNSQPLSFFANLAILLVWVFYAQLLLSSFRRKRKSRVIITHGWGAELNSLCLVSNMSEEPVYILRIVLTLTTETGQHSLSVTDYGELAEDTPRTPAQMTRQGPLQSGEYVSLGTFRDMINQLVRRENASGELNASPDELDITSCEITVICVYGPESGVIGARRCFTMSVDGSRALRPDTIDTERLTSRKARKTLLDWLREYP